MGVGFVNQDGSWNLRLDAIPVNGVLQVREWEPYDRRDAPNNGAQAQGSEGPRVQRRDGPPTAPPRDGVADARRPTFPGDALV